MYDRIVVTGCDRNTEWQLPFIINTYKFHNTIPMVVMDFGMTVDMIHAVSKRVERVVRVENNQATGWHLKPTAMMRAAQISRQVCWLDTDCEVVGSVNELFDQIEPGKLAMVEDKPWTKRRGQNGKWYNSGVVAFEGAPDILHRWYKNCINSNGRGDQEILHSMLDELGKLAYITELPNKFNYLRIQHDDGDVVEDVRVYHWTGPKGNQIIKNKMGL